MKAPQAGVIAPTCNALNYEDKTVSKYLCLSTCVSTQNLALNHTHSF